METECLLGGQSQAPVGKRPGPLPEHSLWTEPGWRPTALTPASSAQPPWLHRTQHGRVHSQQRWLVLSPALEGLELPRGKCDEQARCRPRGLMGGRAVHTACQPPSGPHLGQSRALTPGGDLLGQGGPHLLCEKRDKAGNAAEPGKGLTHGLTELPTKGSHAPDLRMLQDGGLDLEWVGSLCGSCRVKSLSEMPGSLLRNFLGCICLP